MISEAFLFKRSQHIITRSYDDTETQIWCLIHLTTIHSTHKDVSKHLDTERITPISCQYRPVSRITSCTPTLCCCCCCCLVTLGRVPVSSSYNINLDFNNQLRKPALCSVVKVAMWRVQFEISLDNHLTNDQIQNVIISI